MKIVKLKDNRGDIALTNKQKKFCLEYVIDFNGKGAAMRAGYSEKTAMQQASRMLRIVKVQEEIKKLTEKIADKAEVQVDEILKEFKIIAFSDISDYFDIKKDNITFKCLADITPEARRAIQGIHQTKNGVLLKLFNKQAALELLGKYRGMFTEKLEAKHSGNITSIVEFVRYATEKKKLK
jgi:phage terminase small subunit